MSYCTVFVNRPAGEHENLKHIFEVQTKARLKIDAYVFQDGGGQAVGGYL